MLECSVVEDGKILELRVFIHIGDMPGDGQIEYLPPAQPAGDKVW